MLYGVRPRAAATCEESHGNQNVAEVSRRFFIFVETSKLPKTEAGVYGTFHISISISANRQLSLFSFLFKKILYSLILGTQRERKDLLLRAHSDGRVNVHGRASFHGIESHVTFTFFPAVKPFPAERTLLGKVSQRGRDVFGSVAHALS